MHEDLYAVLDLKPDASPDDVKTAYKQAALKHHPDKGGSCERFRLVAQAFETLFCPSARAKYDARLGRDAKGQGGSSTPPKRYGKTAAAQGTPEGKRAAPGASQGQPAHDHSRAPDGFGPSLAGRSREMVLKRFLIRLAFKMKALSKPARLGVVDQMNSALKKRLTTFMQSAEWKFAAEHPQLFKRRATTRRPRSNSSKTDEPACKRLRIQSCSTEGSLESDLPSSCQPIMLELTNDIAGLPANGDEQDEKANTSEVSGAGKSNKTQVTVYPGIYMRRGMRCDHYVASAGLENFTIFSRNVRTLEAAVNYHISLMQVKRAFENISAQDKSLQFAERLRRALAQSPALDELGPSFYTVMSNRRTFGARKIRSPATIHLDEALEHHQLLIEGRNQGSEALRAAWVAVLQSDRVVKKGSRGNAIKRPLTRYEAETMAAEAAKSAARMKEERLKQEKRRSNLKFQKATRALRLALHRKARRAQGYADKTSQRMLNLTKLIKKLERLIVLVEARAQRRAASQKRQKEKEEIRLELERKRQMLLEQRQRQKLFKAWRQRERQMTFEEIRRGPPRI